MNREPTVLDFVKSLLRGKPLAIPELQKPPEAPQPSVEQAQEQPAEMGETAGLEETPEQEAQGVIFPWRALAALGLALLAQISLLPRPDRIWCPETALRPFPGSAARLHQELRKAP